jgi:putative transposase
MLFVALSLSSNTKYRRKVFFGNKRIEIGKILRKLCEFKRITIIEAEICPDHVHMLIEIPPKLSVSGVVGFLKGKSSLMIYERRGNMKFKYRNRQFWCRGFYVDTVGKNTAKIKAYIQNQLKEDEEIVQLNIEFHDDPLMGSR